MSEQEFEAYKAESLRMLAAALDAARAERRWGKVTVEVDLQDGRPVYRKLLEMRGHRN